MRGAYTWSNGSVEEKVGLSVGESYTQGAYRRRNTVSYETDRYTGSIEIKNCELK